MLPLWSVEILADKRNKMFSSVWYLFILYIILVINNWDAISPFKYNSPRSGEETYVFESL